MSNSKMKIRKRLKILKKLPYYKKIIRINPFYNKKTGYLLIPALYIFNKIFCMNLHLVPYSSKVGKTAQNLNKCLINSIKYEIRILLVFFSIVFGVYFIINTIENDIKDLVLVMNFAVAIIVLGLIFRILIKATTGKHLNCEQNIGTGPVNSNTIKEK